MENLFCKALLWNVGLISEKEYNETLDALFLQANINDLLLELEGCSYDSDQTNTILKHYVRYEAPQFSYERFGKSLTENLRNIYELKKLSISDFSEKCCALWQQLPEAIVSIDPFHILSYADEPLAWDDEAQTRSLYQSFFDYYRGMKMKPLISVIVPVYNIAPYLARCLDSILTQTHQNLEVLVVNDGSSDGSPSIIDDYARKDSRIVAIHKENGGVSAARRDGILASHGEYIGFVDGDDVIDSDMFERLLHNLLTHDADISHCGYQVHEMDSSVPIFFGNEGQLLTHSTHEALALLLLGEFQPGVCNKLFKRSLVIELIEESQMDLTIKNNEDLLMNFYLFQKSKKSVYDDFCPYHYIKREGSATTCKPVLTKYRDPVRVREIIYKNTIGTELEQIAFKTLLSQYVHMYGKLIMIRERNFLEYANELKQLIRSYKKRLKQLSLKQHLSALLLLYCPPLFRFINELHNRN